MVGAIGIRWVRRWLIAPPVVQLRDAAGWHAESQASCSGANLKTIFHFLQSLQLRRSKFRQYAVIDHFN